MFLRERSPHRSPVLKVRVTKFFQEDVTLFDTRVLKLSLQSLAFYASYLRKTRVGLRHPTLLLVRGLTFLTVLILKITKIVKYFPDIKVK